MTNLKLVFRSLKGPCLGNQFLASSAQPSSGDIRQMVIVYEKSNACGWLGQAEVVHESQWTQAARGVAGRANVSHLALARIDFLISCSNTNGLRFSLFIRRTPEIH